MNKNVAIFCIIVAVSVLPVLTHNAYATSNTITDSSSCQTLGGSWNSNNNTCSILNLTINKGDELDLGSHITLKVNGTLNNEGIIGGTVFNGVGGSISNYGTITNSGAIYIPSGTIISNSGTINNNGVIGSSIASLTFSYCSYGAINNNSDGVLNNNSGGV
ncbi:MAG: hypothetical protein KGI25_05305, partial [Thaumarchaeota archaeon]|nr:hypothetical protein [Nitrososphaerota archaeon]